MILKLLDVSAQLQQCYECFHYALYFLKLSSNYIIFFKLYITYDLPVGPAIPGPPIGPDGPARPVGPGLPISPLAPRSPAKPRNIYEK